MELSSGTIFGGYQVLAPLGRGGQSQVYTARDLSLRRVVALKLLSESYIDDEVARRRFLLEARALSCLNHPGIATVYQVGEVDGWPFIAMEYVEGETLFSRLRSGDLQLSEVLSLMAQVTEAVSFAHSKGVLHRDLKPGNILLTPDGRTKLLDFGLAKLTSESLRERVGLGGELTSAGSVVGTVSYVSPEQARGESIDKRSDLFSLGVIFYEMLAGRRPFEGRTPVATLLAIVNETPAPLSATTVPGELARVVTRLIQKDPAARYASAADVLAALDEAAAALGMPLSSSGARRLASSPRGADHSGGESPRDVTLQQDATPVAPTRRPRHRRRIMIVALVAAAALVSALGLWSRARRARPLVSGHTVVVLPLEGSGEADHRNLAGLVTGQLITTLTRAPELRVLTLSQADLTKGLASRELLDRQGARYQVTGNVFIAGNDLAVTVTMTERSDGRVVWSQTARGRGDEVLSIAARMASGVASAAGVIVVAAELDFPSSQVFDDFTRGDLALASYDPARIDGAVHLLERCLVAQPGFAPTYPRIVRALMQYRNLGLDYNPEYLDRAYSYIRKGLDVDPADQELLANLGWYRLYTYDFQRAHEVLLHAPALSQTSSSSCKLATWSTFYRGEVAAALTTLAQCKARFPFDSSVDLNLVVLNGMLGNTAASQAACRELERGHASDLILTLAQGFQRMSSGEASLAAKGLYDAFSQRREPLVGMLAAQAALAAGDGTGAVTGLRAWLDKNPYSLEAHWLLCLAYQTAGDEAAARRAAAEGERWAALLDTRYHVPTTAVFRHYFAVRAGQSGPDMAAGRAAGSTGEALLTGYLRQITLARLGDRSALEAPITPYSPTFWLNRFAGLEVERLRNDLGDGS